jgi:hypothetical protein
MLKLQVSESWMISRRAAEMRRARERVERWGIRGNFESGAERLVVGCNEDVPKERSAVGSRKEVKTSGMDFVR